MKKACPCFFLYVWTFLEDVLRAGTTNLGNVLGGNWICVFLLDALLTKLQAEHPPLKRTRPANNISGESCLALHWVTCCCSVSTKCCNVQYSQHWWDCSALFCCGKYASCYGVLCGDGLNLHFLLPTLLPYEAVADPAEHCCSSDTLSGME